MPAALAYSTAKRTNVRRGTEGSIAFLAFIPRFDLDLVSLAEPHSHVPDDGLSGSTRRRCRDWRHPDVMAHAAR
jgi:hypothetical protein